MVGGRSSGMTRRGFLIGTVSSPIAYRAGAILATYQLAELLAFLKKAGATPAIYSEALSKLEKKILNAPYDSSSGRQQSIMVLENLDGSINPAPASIISRSDLADRTFRLFGQYDATPDITGIDINGALYVLGKGTVGGQRKFLASLPDDRISDVTQILIDFFQKNELLSYLIRQGIVPLGDGRYYRVALNLNGSQVDLYDLNGPTRAIYKGDATQVFRRMFSFVPHDLMSTASTLYLPRGDDTADTRQWQTIRAELSGSSPQRVITPPVALRNMFPGSRPTNYLTNPGGTSVFGVSSLDSTYNVEFDIKHLLTGGPLNRVRVILGNLEAVTNENGVARFQAPNSLTGIIVDAYFLADGFTTSGKQYMLDGRDVRLEHKIVPTDFPWDLYDAVARSIGADLSNIATTGIPTGGHTVKIENLSPRARYQNNPNTTRYIINTDGSLTRRAITSEMIRQAEDVMTEVINLVSNGEVLLTRNDIEKVNTPFLSLPHPLSQRREYVVLWRDFGDRLLVGLSDISTNGSYITGSLMGIWPGMPAGIYWHEMLIGTGFYGEPQGQLAQKYGPRGTMTIFHTNIGGYLSRPSSTDEKVIKLHAERSPGHKSATKLLPGVGNLVIPDYSPYPN